MDVCGEALIGFVCAHGDRDAGRRAVAEHDRGGVVGKSGDGRQGVLIAVLTSEGRLHPPDGQERPRRGAVALLDGCEERRLGLLQRATARDNGRGTALGEKLVERQAKASLAAIGGDGGLPRDNQGETAASIRMRMRRGWTDGARA
jgi:hypothetical protein